MQADCTKILDPKQIDEVFLADRIHDLLTKEELKDLSKGKIHFELFTVPSRR
jgi:hypothetical protein